MDKTPSFDQFKLMIADHLGVDVNRITKDTSFLDDLGIDSLSLVNFIIKLEKMYQIKIELDHVWQLKNIGEAYEILRQRITSV
ncbi:MAG TPA: acyl carrier protein [Bacillota bacterium]|nr:acyl carrier protein [Bacillota bacterium]